MDEETGCFTIIIVIGAVLLTGAITDWGSPSGASWLCLSVAEAVLIPLLIKWAGACAEDKTEWDRKERAWNEAIRWEKEQLRQKEQRLEDLNDFHDWTRRRIEKGKREPVSGDRGGARPD
jgi:hypothetical protein